MIPQPHAQLDIEELLDSSLSGVPPGVPYHDAIPDECMDIDVTNDIYSWEVGYDKTWELLKENDGLLDTSVFLDSFKKPSSRPATLSEEPTERGVLRRKGVLRNLVILLDASENMQETDYKPNRFYSAISIVEDVVPRFFRSNPLSRMALIAMLHRQAIPITTLNSSSSEIVQFLKGLREQDVTEGSLSLLNGFKKCCTILASSPPYSTREILLIFGSIHTCDSGDISGLLDELVSLGIRLTVISLTPELYILRKATQMTHGTYIVARSLEEFKESVENIRHAIDWESHTETRLVPMGFPKQMQTTVATLCMCHNRLSLRGYLCPRCRGKVCTLPTQCRVCDLHIASFLDVARTTQQYAAALQHVELTPGTHVCGMCECKFYSQGFRCLACETLFCGSCHYWRSTILQQCPGCMTSHQVTAFSPPSQESCATMAA